MKAVYAILLGLLLTACNTTPQIIPDNSGDSVIMKRLNHEIQNGGSGSTWGWVLWYLPIVLIALAWAWKEWVRPSINALENEDIDNIKKYDNTPKH